MNDDFPIPGRLKLAISALQNVYHFGTERGPRHTNEHMKNHHAGKFIR